MTTKARRSSLPAVVEKTDELTVFWGAPLSPDATASIATELTVAVCAVKLIPGIFAPLTATDWLGGVKLKPFLLGVTV